jgi:hypothetical protein
MEGAGERETAKGILDRTDLSSASLGIGSDQLLATTSIWSHRVRQPLPFPFSCSSPAADLQVKRRTVLRMFLGLWTHRTVYGSSEGKWDVLAYALPTALSGHLLRNPSPRV